MVNLSLKRLTIASVGWKLLEKSGRAVVELAVQIVMARILAPEQFGALAVILAFVNIGNVLVQSGLNAALVQTPDMDDDDCSTVFWLSFAVSLAMYVILFLAAPFIEASFDSGEIVWPIRAIGLVFFLNSLNAVQVAIVQRNLQLRKVFKATLSAVLVSGCLGIALAFAGTGLWALVCQQLCYVVVNCLVMFLQVDWKPKAVFVPSRAQELFSFGWKILIAALLEQGYQGVSDLVVGRKFDSAALGFVSQGKKYPQALGTVLDGAIQPVMLSAVSRVQDDLSTVKCLARRALKTSTYLVFPVMTFFAVAAEPMVRVILGEQWVPCVPYFQVYCFIYALLPIHSTNLQVLNGIGRSDLFLKFELIRKSYAFALLMLAALLSSDPIWLVGCYALANIISTFVNMWPINRLVSYTYGEQCRDFAPAVALSTVSGAAAWAAGSIACWSVATALLQAGVMAFLYLLLSVLFRVESFQYIKSTVTDLVRNQ